MAERQSMDDSESDSSVELYACKSGGVGSSVEMI